MSRLHVAVDDFSRVAYAELLPHEQKGTCAAFMARCLRFFAGLGVRAERVMTDNGPGYRSGELNGPLASEVVRHLYARPYSPWQNGKIERMNRILHPGMTVREGVEQRGREGGRPPGLHRPL